MGARQAVLVAAAGWVGGEINATRTEGSGGSGVNVAVLVMPAELNLGLECEAIVTLNLTRGCARGGAVAGTISHRLGDSSHVKHRVAHAGGMLFVDGRFEWLDWWRQDVQLNREALCNGGADSSVSGFPAQWALTTGPRKPPRPSLLFATAKTNQIRISVLCSLQGEHGGFVQVEG